MLWLSARRGLCIPAANRFNPLPIMKTRFLPILLAVAGLLSAPLLGCSAEKKDAKIGRAHV